MEFSQLLSELQELRKDDRFFDMDIQELRMILIGQYSLNMPLPDLKRKIKSIAGSLNFCLTKRGSTKPNLSHLSKDLSLRLTLLFGLLHFAKMHGKQIQSIDLVVHCAFLAVNAKCMCKLYKSDHEEEEVRGDISQLQQKVKLLGPQIREISVRVLTALKSESISSVTFTLEKNRHRAAGIVYLHLDVLMQLLECYTTFTFQVQDQMLKLHKALRFLIVILAYNGNELPGGNSAQFDELRDKMKDRIRVVVIDVGIVICSLSVNEMKYGLAKETDLALIDLLKELQFVRESFSKMFPLPSSSSLSFPRTNELGFVEFLLENLKELTRSRANSIAFPIHKILAVQEDFLSLRSCLEKIAEQRNQNQAIQTFWSHVVEVAYKAEVIIDSALVGDKHESCLDAIARDISILKVEAKEINDNNRNDGKALRATKTFIHMPSQVTAQPSHEDLVGRDDEVKIIINRLKRGSMQLDIIPIWGMPGLGKTTLANKVYCDPSIEFHFYIRAWCCVSQVYSMRSLLLQILHGTGFKSSNQSLEMSDDDLEEKLRKVLRRNKYLIVLDDLWDIEAWNLLKRSLPDDANGSRILFTSRFENFSSQIKQDSKPHHLRLLTDEESWQLLQNKLFGKEVCPPTLSKVGLRIANNCRGLPLTIILIGGILATTERDCAIWEEVAKSLSSGNVPDTERWMKTLELSYSHLPDYLKPCLLYFSAFQEDRDISVQRLLWLWISEGFVQKSEGKSFKDVADEYLMDLTARSLVMVTKERTMGGAKACRLHDLVHEFCVVKAKEESFLQIFHGDDVVTYTGLSNPYRLFIYSMKSSTLEELKLFLPNLRSLLFFVDYDGIHHKLDLSPHGFLLPRLLRVLDLRKLFLGEDFPMELVSLVHLRYMAIRGHIEHIPSAIANLSKLESFLLKGSCANVVLPNTIWNIKTLQHLRTSSFYGFIFPFDNLEVCPDLNNLDTLSLAVDPHSQNLQKILKKLPSIRRLKCVGDKSGESTANCNKILTLSYLTRLESLNLDAFVGYEFEFPSSLKKLTLWSNLQPWSSISRIGKLPNLEVLKLYNQTFVGEKWEVEEGEFPDLRFLELSNLDIRRWTASSDNFSLLEKLVLHRCVKLEEVPSCLGESPFLEMIEVSSCGESTVNAIKQIQQEQMDMGNEALKIVY
ncbi:putative late blight resistance protein homolog R1A-3 [Coffea arabica]|uniref:Late blight resistance protein homolog R1A-3 n=1 Tax=Coffea arabica TaxID=13443 RepID=A0ABM4V5F1_COFAR|nr:putative late blight resistance protein homolog R1A-3 [Coffea arabica]